MLLASKTDVFNSRKRQKQLNKHPHQQRGIAAPSEEPLQTFPSNPTSMKTLVFRGLQPSTAQQRFKLTSNVPSSEPYKSTDYPRMLPSSDETPRQRCPELKTEPSDRELYFHHSSFFGINPGIMCECHYGENNYSY